MCRLYKKNRNIMDLMEKLVTQRKATTTEQFQLLLKEIEKQPFLGKEFPLGGENKVKVEKAWCAIGAKLNNIGPPSKKPCAWRKVWTDLRIRTKKKIAENMPHTASSSSFDDTTLCNVNGFNCFERKAYKILQTFKEPAPSRMSSYDAQLSHEANESDAVIPKIEPEEFVAESEEEIVTSFRTFTPDELLVRDMPPKEPTLSARPTTDEPPRKKRYLQQQTKLLKQLQVTQVKILKIAKAQNNVTKQQMSIFSEIAGTMAKHATAVEKQSNAITEILKILKQRKL